MKREWRRLFCGFGVIVSLGVGSPILCGAAEDAALATAEAERPLRAALVLTPEFCKTILQVEGTGLNAFGLGHFACKDLEPALKGFFSGIAVVQEMPAPGAAQIVLQPRLLDAGG